MLTIAQPPVTRPLPARTIGSRPNPVTASTGVWGVDVDVVATGADTVAAVTDAGSVVAAAVIVVVGAVTGPTT